MERKGKRFTAIIIALLMMLGTVSSLGISALAAEGDPITVRRYSNGVQLMTEQFATLYEAMNWIGDADRAEVSIAATYRGDDTNFTIRNSGTILISMGSSISLFSGGIVIDNASATLELSNFKQSAAGTAINVKNGRLVLNSGAEIVGSSRGIINTGGTTVFSGGKTSSYDASDSGSTTGTPSLITPNNNVKVTGVSIVQRDFELSVGNTSVVTAQISPQNATNTNVTWATGDSSILTISTTGTLMARGTGTTWVRATTADGSFVSSIYVKVVASSTKVTGISVTPNSLNLAAGKVSQLRESVSPTSASNKAVTWTSNDTNVATVSASGVVTAKNAGSARITVKTSDGNYTATTLVTVSGATASLAVSSDIARNSRMFLDEVKIGGSVAKSSSYVRLRPSKTNSSEFNSLNVSVRAFDRLSEDRYSSLRYFLPWIYIDMYPGFSKDLKSSAYVEMDVRKLTSKTMSTRMNSAWKGYVNNNVAGPWELVSNSDQAELVLRILLPKKIGKSSLYLLRWNGSKFERMATSTYNVVAVGSSYFVRTSKVEPGIYAVVYR